MEIVFTHYRYLDKSKKIKEGHYTLLALSITETTITGIVTEAIPDSVGLMLQESPEKYTNMTSLDALQWIKKVAPASYRTGWRSWMLRKNRAGLGALIEKRLKIGQKHD